MKTEHSLYALTDLDVAALRKCDDVIFRHSQGMSTVEAYKRIQRTPSNPFADDARHVIPADCTAVNYSAGCMGRTMAPDRFEAFESQQAGSYGTNGIAAFLRVGDMLTLEWAADGGLSPALQEGAPGWHSDTLHLRVRRGKSDFRFMVERSVCQNNTARMVRPLGYSLVTQAA